MNLAVDDSLHGGIRQGDRRFLAGVGISLAVHLLLMFAFRQAGLSAPVFQPEAPASMTVRLVPPAAPQEAPRVEPAAPQPGRPARPRSARKSTPQPVIAVPASPRQEEAPDTFTVPQAQEAPSAPSEAPRFDMRAARQTARQLAGQTKLGREGLANAQFPDPPLETESRLSKAIGKAKRRNCKDGIPGGLLAPLYLMMDKKDHGCKW